MYTYPRICYLLSFPVLLHHHHSSRIINRIMFNLNIIIISIVRASLLHAYKIDALLLLLCHSATLPPQLSEFSR